ncbi:MAG: hypothetical protein SchgKO_14240 [Schleiferiaceae bacterium]
MKLAIRQFMFILLLGLAPWVIQGQITGSGDAYRPLNQSYAEIPPGIDTLSFPFTLCTWVQPSGFNRFPLFSSQVNDSAYSGFNIEVGISSIDVTFGDGTGFSFNDYRRFTAGTGRFWLSGQWTHIAVKFNSEVNVQVYVNGVFKPATVSGNGGSMDLSSLRSSALGYLITDQGDQFLQGTMDEFGIWNRGLLPEEIRKIMTTGVDNYSSDLVLSYSMDSNTGTTIPDQSTNNWDANLVGTTHNFPLSGAAIGDTSVWVYSRANSISLSWPGGNGPTASVNSNRSWGMYLYRIDGAPSSTNGLTPCPQDTIWGAFHIWESAFGNPYPITISGFGNSVVSRREGNFDLTWSTNSFPNGSFVDTNRTEFVFDRFLESNDFLKTPDTIVCGSSYVLRGPQLKNGLSLQWSTVDTTQNTTVTTSGRYFLEVTTDCFVARDSVFVTFYDQPNFDIPDTVICGATTIEIGLPSLASGTYLWSNGQVGDSAIFTTPGTYLVSANNGPCTYIDTFSIIELPPLAIPDGSICGTQPAAIAPDLPGVVYTWSDGSTGSQFFPTTPGTYWVQQQLNTCVQTDTFEVVGGVFVIDELPDFKAACINSDVSFTVSDLGYPISWSNGDLGFTARPVNSGWLRVSYQTPCGDISDSVYVDFIEDCKEEVFYEPSAFSPNGDGVNDFYEIKGFSGNQFHIYIYDRWGRLVFESTDPNFSWDGSNAESGVYMARFSYRDALDEEGERITQITLYK